MVSLVILGEHEENGRQRTPALMYAALENGHAVGVLYNDSRAHLLEQALALETGRVSVIGRHERVALQASPIASVFRPSKVPDRIHRQYARAISS